jgi:predicted alpha/beta-fold hydrolase
MPILEHSAYVAPRLMRNAHVSTVFASTYRRVSGVHYTRERLELPDGDFLDLDWSVSSSQLAVHSSQIENSDFAFSVNCELPTVNSKLAILTHGYLGSASRQYMLGAAKAFNAAGYDVLAWNHRGLGGEANRTERVTTHGSTDDLGAVVSHALRRGYADLALVGFSKGGNLTLKYLGELGEATPTAIRAAVAISVPTDLDGSWAACRGTFYEWYFTKKLRQFMAARQAVIPPERFREFARFRTLDDYTTEYIAPLFGWKDYRDYCEQCSALPYLRTIRVPSLILNAQNDPVLSESCSPADLARQSDFVFLETPTYGGHCGFYEKSTDELYWMDRRAVEFCSLKV